MAAPIDYQPYKHFFQCPACGGELDFRQHTIECTSCARTYEYRDGIAALLYEEGDCIPLEKYLKFYDRPETIRAMNLHLGRNAASRRMYLIDKAIRRSKPQSYLELSTGAGVTTQMAIKAGAHPVISLDVSSELLLEARKQHGEQFLPLIADARFMPIRDNSVDFVLNSNLIEHLDLWKECLLKSLDVSRRTALISTDTRSQGETIDFAPFGEHQAGHMHVYNHFALKELIQTRASVRECYIYTFYAYHYKTEKANRRLNTDIYGVGRGKKVFPATPPYIADHPSDSWRRRLKKSALRWYGRLVNSWFLDRVEKESYFLDRLRQKDYPLASMYITAK